MTAQFFAGWIAGIITTIILYVGVRLYEIYKEEKQKQLENEENTEWKTKE